MLISPRPEYLATSTERQALDTITALEEIISTNPDLVDHDVKRRVKRLRGMLLWEINSEYDQRLTTAYNNLVDLDEIIKKLKIVYNSFIRTRQAATQSYEGYTIPIRQSRTRLFSAQRKLKGVMAKQGRLLETMAINELDRRRKRLEEYQIKARFALAESYDRATKAEVDAEIETQRRLHEGQKEAEEMEPVKQDEPPVQENNDKQTSQLQTNVDVDNEAIKYNLSFKEKLLSQ